MMIIFKKHKIKIAAPTDGNTRILSLLSTSTIHQRIKKIQSLVGVTQQDFLKIYIKTVVHFIEYILKTILSPENITEQLSLKLDEVILALRKRQGYLLPLGADSEQVFREQEIWSFAIFTAALFNDISEKARFEIAQSLTPPEPYQWLKRHTHVFESWFSYLSLESTATIFNEIIQRKTDQDINIKNNTFSVGEDSKLDVEPIAKTESITHSHNLEPLYQNLTEKPYSIEEPSCLNKINQYMGQQDAIQTSDKLLNISTLTTENNPITEINLNQLRAEQEQKNNFTPSNHKENSLESKNNMARTLKAEAFWEWISELIKSNPTKTAEHGIYCVTLGILVALPNAIDQFIKHVTNAHDKTLSQNTLSLKSRITLTKDIKKQPLLIRNTQGSRIHTYYKGSWKERQMISGVIISITSLLGESIPLAVDLSLTPDLINTI